MPPWNRSLEILGLPILRVNTGRIGLRKFLRFQFRRLDHFRCDSSKEIFPAEWRWRLDRSKEIFSVRLADLMIHSGAGVSADTAVRKNRGPQSLLPRIEPEQNRVRIAPRVGTPS